MEIECKYLVAKLPEHLEQYPSERITQAYVLSRPVVRARKIEKEDEVSYILTVKGQGMRVREEHELVMDAAAYEQLLEKRDGRILSKIRYQIPLDQGLIAELDVYLGDFEGLYTVEVEFESVEAMEAFRAPVWFGEDISERSEYKNSYLCTSADLSGIGR